MGEIFGNILILSIFLWLFVWCPARFFWDEYWDDRRSRLDAAERLADQPFKAILETIPYHIRIAFMAEHQPCPKPSDREYPVHTWERHRITAPPAAQRDWWSCRCGAETENNTLAEEHRFTLKEAERERKEAEALRLARERDRRAIAAAASIPPVEIMMFGQAKPVRYYHGVDRREKA